MESNYQIVSRDQTCCGDYLERVLSENENGELAFCSPWETRAIPLDFPTPENALDSFKDYCDRGSLEFALEESINSPGEYHITCEGCSVARIIRLR